MWAQVINAALGLWLMAAPSVFGYGAPAAHNDRIIGPVIATFAIIAWWETTRPVARWNVPLGVWLLVAPWVLGYGTTAAIVNSLVVGLLVAGLAAVRGQYRPERFGGGWAALWQSDAGREPHPASKPHST
jgi:hypothetical protein